MSPIPQDTTLDRSALLAQALSHYRAARYEQALPLFRFLIDGDRLDPSLFFYGGTTALHLGDTREAARMLEECVRIAPNAVAFNNLGLALQKLGREQEAIGAFERAIIADPSYAAARYNNGVVLQSLGRLSDALDSYDSAIALEANHAKSHNNRGLILGKLGRIDEAIRSYQMAISSKPDFAEAHSNLAIAWCELERFGDALESSERAIQLRRDFAEAHNNRGVALLGLERPQEALESFDRALQFRPAYAEALTNRGNALHDLGRFGEALASHERAIEIEPRLAQAHTNRGVELRDLGRSDEAVASHDVAIGLKPDFSGAYINRGNALVSVGRFADALASYDRAIELNPAHGDAYWSKALCKLLIGDLDEGWRLYEWRWKSASRKYARHFRQPLWLGDQPVAGKTILIYSEQGLGDFIQCCRYVPMVERLGARVILEVPPSLVSLMGTLNCECTVVEAGRDLPDFDLQCPIMSLPLAFRSDLATIPADVPYLFADDDRRLDWENKLGPRTGLRVGIVWSTGHDVRSKGIAEQKRRDIPLSALRPLKIDGVHFYSLQVGAAAVSELRTLTSAGWGGPEIADHTGGIKDFADTAALIANLDLVVSVCTAVAHLAGAMGKKTWVLLQQVADWRWFLDRKDSPWYPDVTLFRQSSFDDWSGVVAEVREKLIEQAGGLS